MGKILRLHYNITVLVEVNVSKWSVEPSFTEVFLGLHYNIAVLVEVNVSKWSVEPSFTGVF